MSTAVATPLSSAMVWRAWIGAGLLIVGAAGYLVAEAVTASAWRNPRYSYIYNPLGDLSVHERVHFEGRIIESPLASIMDSGYLLHGICIVAAALLLRGTLTVPMARHAMVVLTVLHACGNALLACLHTSPAAHVDDTQRIHHLGIVLAVCAGNMVFVVVGRNVMKGKIVAGLPMPRATGVVTAGLGLFGLAAFVVVTMTLGSPYLGLLIRSAVYPFIAAELFSAAVVIWTLLRARTQR